jgi:hypothetical protein
MPMPMGEGGQPGEMPEVDPAREALVKDILDRIENAKTFHSKAFERIREDMKFAAGKQWPAGADPDNYVANVVLRHVQQRVSTLYAKNPRAVAKRRPVMDYQIWDGKAESLMQAMTAMQTWQQMAATDPAAASAAMAGIVPPEVQQAQMLMQDIQRGKARADMINRIGKTLEILFHYYLNEPNPKFKTQAKQLVRRVVTCGVGYIWLGYQRILDKNPEISGKIADFQRQLEMIQRISEEVAEGEVNADEGKMEQLRLMIQELQAKEEVIVREGLVFDFPKTLSIIIDPECTQIKGFVGARWIAREFIFTPERVREIYGVNLEKGKYTTYDKVGNKSNSEKDSYACVYEFYNKEDGLVYPVCVGYLDFLREPEGPNVEIEQFFPCFALSFNDTETEGADDEVTGIYPPSDVYLLRHPQREINRSREALRQHRKANTPQYAAARGMLSDEDKAKLGAAVPHEVVELQALQQGQKVEDVVQAIKKHGVDPNLYETAMFFQDIQFVGGQQEANLGGISRGSATESSIAEGSRLVSASDAIDEIDECLSELARASGQVLLKEIAPETAKKIAGPGAVWPEMSRQEIMEELFLEVKAGSSGRPNKAQHIANLKDIMPFAIQMPGMNPSYWGRKLIEAMDDDFDVEEAIVEGLPSIVAMNSAKQPSTGDPSNDPGQQGREGEKKQGHERANDVENGQDRPRFPSAAPGESGGAPAGAV